MKIDSLVHKHTHSLAKHPIVSNQRSNTKNMKNTTRIGCRVIVRSNIDLFLSLSLAIELWKVRDKLLAAEPPTHIVYIY